MGRLEGTCAFVTGAGGGIGRSICERFLAEGARVAAFDIDLAAAHAALGAAADDGRGVALRCDVGDADSVRQAIAKATRALGRSNVECNVTGGSTLRDGPVTEAPDDEFWRAIRRDLYGTFACCKHGLPEMIRAGGGSVINMTSVVALMAVPERDCYAAAKGGVIAHHAVDGGPLRAAAHPGQCDRAWHHAHAPGGRAPRGRHQWRLVAGVPPPARACRAAGRGADGRLPGERRCPNGHRAGPVGRHRSAPELIRMTESIRPLTWSLPGRGAQEVVSRARKPLPPCQP